MQCYYAPVLSRFYVLSIHPLLDGTFGGATAFSFSQLLVSGKATLCKGGDCDVRRSSEWLRPTFGSRGCESPEGNRVDLVKVQGGDLSGLWPLKLITIPK